MSKNTKSVTFPADEIIDELTYRAFITEREAIAEECEVASLAALFTDEPSWLLVEVQNGFDPYGKEKEILFFQNGDEA